MMKKYCVIGSPIGHSKSPQLHNAGFREMNLEASFDKILVEPEDLQNWIKVEAPKYEGIAVTIPHKAALMEIIKKQAPAAQNIGAINTLYWHEDILFGTNTDSIGAIRAIHTEMEDLKNKKVLVLGAGGASRAIIFGLITAEAPVSVYNRTLEKAKRLQQDLEFEIIEDLDFIQGEKFDLIINATSVGLREWKSPVPENFFHSHQVVFDIVYDPLETKFCFDADQAGARVITGDKMLVFQALEQFRIWQDIELAPEVMENAFFNEV